MIESEISKDKPYLLNDDFTVTQTEYDISDEDLVINYTATKQVTGAIAMIKEWKYAKSFTSNTITFANSDFEVGVNEISVIDVNYSDGGYGRFTGTIRVTKNSSVPVPPPPAVDNPPTISQNIRNQEGVLGDTFTISYVASDDNEIVKHEIFNGSNWLLKTPTSDGNNHSVDIRFTKKGVKNCRIRVTDSKNQIAESNEFSIMVNEIANNTLEIIDTPYIFKDSEKVVLKYRSNSRFTSAYLYGTGETINSESVTTNTITFPALKVGAYTAYVGAYFNGDKLVESNRFELTITKDVVSPPVVDNPPTVSNNIINQNGYINDTFTITYNASDDNNITKHEFYDGNSWITKNPSKSGDNYTFTHKFENTGQKQCRVRVTDGNNQSVSSNIFTINIDNTPSVNNPPVISNVVVTGVDFNGNYTLNWTSTDRDNDNLTHRLKINSDNYVVISPVKVGNTYKYKGSSLGVGSHTCYIEVSDGKQSVVSKAFSITIPQKPASLKAELKQAKDNYDLKHADLVSIITDIISDGRFDGDTERVLLESAILNYNDAYTKYHEVANRSMDSINDKKVNDAKSAFSKEVEDLNNALGNLEGTMNDAFKQGVLSDAEKISIKQGLKNIENEKSDVDAKYISLYENPDLIGEAKTNLKNSYDVYILKYNNLVAVVNDIVSKSGIIDSVDQNRWNNALNEYRIASADFNKKGNDAINSISKKQSKDAEENAKTFTKGEIKILNDSIASKVSQTVYDNNNKVIEDKFSEVKQDVNKVSSTVSTIEKDYVTTSRLEQTVNGWEFQLSQTGTPQLIPNGDNKKGLNFWHDWYANLVLEKTSYTRMIHVSPTGDVNGRVSFGVKLPSFDLIAGRYYTVAFWVESSKINTLNYNFLYNGDAGYQRIDNISFNTPDGILKRYNITFRAQQTKNTSILLGYEGAYEQGLYFRVSEVCCFEGTKAYPYRGCDEEIYSGNAFVDRSGMGMKHDDGSICRMTPKEFEATNTAGQKKAAIKKGSFNVYDINNGDLLGNFTSNKVTSSYRGITTGLAGSAHYYAIGATTELTDDDQLNMVPYILIAQQDLHNFLGIPTVSGGINFMNTPCIFHKSPLFKSSPRFEGGFTILKDDWTPLDIYYSKNSLHIDSNLNLPTGGSFHGGGLYGGDTTNIGYKIGGANVDVIKLYANIQQIDFLRPLNMNNFGIYNATLAFAAKSMPMALRDKSYAKYNQEEEVVEIDASKGIINLAEENISLTKENGDLKKKQEIQEKEIVTSMLANASLYESMLEFTPQTLNLRNTSENPMVDVYVSLIKKQVKTLKDIPEILKEQVELKLKNNK